MTYFWMIPVTLEHYPGRPERFECVMQELAGIRDTPFFNRTELADHVWVGGDLRSVLQFHNWRANAMD